MKADLSIRSGESAKARDCGHIGARLVRFVRQHTGKTVFGLVALVLSAALVLSSLPVFTLTATADPTTSQTKYASINDYQKARMAEIQRTVFDLTGSEYETRLQESQDEYGSVIAPTPIGMLTGSTVQEEKDLVRNYKVKNGNPYFNWKDPSEIICSDGESIETHEKNEPGFWKWDGKKHTTFDKAKFKKKDGSLITAASDLETVNFPPSVSTQITLRIFNVENAYQLQFALTYTSQYSNNYLINIVNDIDLSGYVYDETSDRNWLAIKYGDTQSDSESKIYIEGNGHTIYNMRTSNGGLIQIANADLIVKNLGISNSMVFQAANVSSRYDLNFHNNNAGLLYSHISNTNCKVLLYNVHGQDSYIQNLDSPYTGGLTGWNGATGGVFFQNCSTSNLTILGQDHVGGLASNVSSQDCKKSYTALQDQPDDPIQRMNKYERFVIDEDNTYPIVFDTCYSVDCELFSIGVDSGAFVSCGYGIIAKNCYTNNNIYSDSNTGGFIGRVVYHQRLLDANKHATLSAYFDSCYSSGIVEGRNAMGGFVGLVAGHRRMQLSYTAADMGNEDALQPTSETSSALFHNCYSTSAVGMDYAGRYCGGFVGLDDSVGTNIAIQRHKDVNMAEEIGPAVTANGDTGGEKITFNGSAYLNCYAAGEVGNILTVTDLQKAANYEASYIKNNEGKDNATTTDKKFPGVGSGYIDKVEILPYYPSGGFIGALAPDRWWVPITGAYNGKTIRNYGAASDAMNYAYGYFANCYYDMQTTGMREMAIGMHGGDYGQAYANENDLTFKSGYTKVDLQMKTSNGALINNFSLPGVQGLYTTTAEDKVRRIEPNNQATDPNRACYGLTEFPVQDENTGVQMWMDSCTPAYETEGTGDQGARDDKILRCAHWRYEKGYYPQLRAFVNIHNEANSLENHFNEFTQQQIPESPFYVKPMPDTDSDKEVKYDPYAYNVDKSIQVNTAHNDTIVLRAYRYAQASTAAVMLDTYNYIMSASGSLYSDRDWAVALAENEMKFNPHTGYWSVFYDGLNAGTYHFKVHANDNMTYNYGANKFDDSVNCTFEVSQDGTDVVIRFKYTDLFSTAFQICVDVYNGECTPSHVNDEEYNAKKYTYDTYDGTIDHTVTFGSAKVYSLIGNLPGCNDWNTNIDMVETTDNPDLVETELNFPVTLFTKDQQGAYIPLEYSFKVRVGTDWTENYGYDGALDGTNMTFTLKQPTKVKFQFNRSTHKVTLFIDVLNYGYVQSDFTPGPEDQDKLEALQAYCEESYIADHNVYNYTTYTVVSDIVDLVGEENRWGSAQSVAEKSKIASEGVMTTSSNSGSFIKTYQEVPTGANYQIRILPYDTTFQSAQDNDTNYFFYIQNNRDDPQTCTLTITYTPATEEIPATVIYNAFGDDSQQPLTIKDSFIPSNADYPYVVGGDENLIKDTVGGLAWLGSDKTKIPTNDPSGEPTSEEISDYVQRAKDAGRMDKAGGNYTKKFTGLPASDTGYAFKIFGDGNVDFGFGVKGGTSNITFKLTEPADVTVTFNPDNHLTKVESTPKEALSMTEYVVTGTENLMGRTWDFATAVMNFNLQSGLYEYIIGANGLLESPVPGRNDYAFKVIEKGIDSGSNISFHLNNDAYIKVTYDPKTAKVEYEAYNDVGCTSQIVHNTAFSDIVATSYSVLGDDGLTGYKWLGLMPNGDPYDDPVKRKEMEAAATKAGRLEETSGSVDPEPNKEDTDNRRIYSKRFNNVAVGVEGAIKAYSFKVAVNGNWDSGISYGDGPNNFILNLANTGFITNPRGSGYSSCDVVVYFKAPDGTFPAKIWVETFAPGGTKTDMRYYLDTVNDEDWVWYVVGDASLASFDVNFTGEPTVYDTVRDITHGIRFTDGSDSLQKGVAWEMADEKNTGEGYIDKFGGKADSSLNGNTGFTLDFTVDGKKAQVKYDEDIITLDTSVDTGDAIGYEEKAAQGYNQGLGKYMVLTELQAKLNDFHLDDPNNPTYHTAYRNFIGFPIPYTVDRFMPGKQFLAVHAYGLGTNEAYNRWKAVRIVYDQLVLRAEDLREKSEQLLLRLGNNNGSLRDYITQNGGTDDEEGNVVDVTTLTGIPLLNAFLKKLDEIDNARYQYYVDLDGFDYLKYLGEWKTLHEWLHQAMKDTQNYGIEFPSDNPQHPDDDFFFSDDVKPLDAPYVPEVRTSPEKGEYAQITGMRILRLIPKGYIEAGNDATVAVLENDTTTEENRKNVVVYDAENPSPNVTASFTDDSDAANTAIDTKAFTYYNFAFMMGYAITDKIGLGIYDNYDHQDQPYIGSYGITKYLNDSRDEDDNREIGKYYAMTSAYTQTDGYNDLEKIPDPSDPTHSNYLETDGFYRDENGNLFNASKNPQDASTYSNLSVGTLEDQILIGDSVEKDTGKTDPSNPEQPLKGKGQTIIKIYQVYNKGTDEETETIVQTEQPKNNDDKAERFENYRKWTGREKFTREDANDGSGTDKDIDLDGADYRVKMYWMMNDGRYFEDSKDVKILYNYAGIEKYIVDPEREAPDNLTDQTTDEAAGSAGIINLANNTITYYLHYTNSVSADPVTFSILDIFPFKGDERLSEQIGVDEQANANKHTALGSTENRDFKFKLKEIDIRPTSVREDNAQNASILGIYYSTNPDVRQHLYDDTGNVDDKAAQRLGVKPAPDELEVFNADKENPNTPPVQVEAMTAYKYGEIIDPELGNWKKVGLNNEDTNHYGVYSFEDVEDVTAIAVTGIQLQSADGVEVRVTLEYGGVPNDDLYNNGFYWSGYDAHWQYQPGIKNEMEYTQETGITKPVRTTVVGRDLTGDVWLDSDTDGEWDANEPAIENVKVSLVPYTSEGILNFQSDTVKVIFTDNTGHYHFPYKDLRAGDFRIVFSAPDDGNVTLHSKDGTVEDQIIPFNTLNISKTNGETDEMDYNISHIQTAGDAPAYYIDLVGEKNLPNKQTILDTADVAFGVNIDKVDPAYYYRMRQDLALTDSLGSITIVKKGEDGNALSGIQFKVEYKDGEDWVPLTYNIIDGVYDIDETGQGSVGPIFTTGSDGTITLPNLLQTQYRITEVVTEGDLNPLVGPIVVTLPYDSKANQSNIVTVTDGKEPDGDTWLDITITLTNTTKLSDYLPMSGESRPFPYWIPVCGVLLIGIGAAAVIYGIKRKQSRNRAR